jgi:hypothetical protein
LRFAEVTLADLPSIALTDYNPMKVPLAVARKIGVSSARAPAPPSGRTHLIADRI